MKLNNYSLLLGVIALSQLSGCTYIKSLFPDKEKDYQYTNEIPPLIFPEDLKKSAIPSLTPSSSTISSITKDLPDEESSFGTTTPKTPINSTLKSKGEEDATDVNLTAEQIILNESQNRLHINTPLVASWRIVNKTLSRKAIEITDRNVESRTFTVRFKTENEQTSASNSYWSGIKSLFGSTPEIENVYLLKLDENNLQTDVTVIDENKNLLSDPGSIKLLQVLAETIRKNLVTQ